ncbi:MAG: DUF5361 domain-containing protein [Clostridium sp.]|nr:DUF5361 domain-containing protein [Clostridium sp.]MCM1207651.1 DUF5361 domain-containing protein [Ruminococcus sp.]
MVIKKYKDDFICDMAQTYGIYDYEALPVRVAATLAAGLQENSRVFRKMTGQPDTKTLLLAGIYDIVHLLLWSRTKDGEHNRNRPAQIVGKILKKNGQPDKTLSFASGEEFKKYRDELTKGVE